jgi:hypothetical protein
MKKRIGFISPRAVSEKSLMPLKSALRIEVTFDSRGSGV